MKLEVGQVLTNTQANRDEERRTRVCETHYPSTLSLSLSLSFHNTVDVMRTGKEKKKRKEKKRKEKKRKERNWRQKRGTNPADKSQVPVLSSVLGHVQPNHRTVSSAAEMVPANLLNVLLHAFLVVAAKALALVPLAVSGLHDLVDPVLLGDGVVCAEALEEVADGGVAGDLGGVEGDAGVVGQVPGRGLAGDDVHLGVSLGEEVVVARLEADAAARVAQVDGREVGVDARSRRLRHRHGGDEGRAWDDVRQVVRRPERRRRRYHARQRRPLVRLLAEEDPRHHGLVVREPRHRLRVERGRPVDYLAVQALAVVSPGPNSRGELAVVTAAGRGRGAEGRTGAGIVPKERVISVATTSHVSLRGWEV